MGCRQGPSRRAKLIGVIVVVLALALIVPSVASAAPTTFTYRRPVANSNTTNTQPRISVLVRDRDGVTGGRGNGYIMSIDRVQVPVTRYRYRGYGYTYFKLYYDPPAPLAEGQHRVHVKIKDSNGNVTRTTWYFRVDTIAPVTTAGASLPKYPGVFIIGLSAADGGSGVSRTFWQLDDGPVMEGMMAWGNLGIGSHTLKYWSVDRAGNVEMVRTLTSDVMSSHTTPASACSTAGCHRIGLADIHVAKGCDPCHGTGKVPSSDCGSAGCHVVNPHADGGHPVIESTSTPSCTQAACHTADAVAVHGGGCAACHASDDPIVMGAISAGDAKCESCHGDAYVHPGAAVAHAIPDSGCKTSGCHSTGTVDTIHADTDSSCTACHQVGEPLTKVCVTCHTMTPDGHTPGDHVSVESTSSPACTNAGCHGSAVVTIHADGGCAACHDDAVVWANVVAGATKCESCHGAHVHAGAPAAHVIPDSGCKTVGCHSTGTVASIHAGTDSSCFACHKVDTPLTKVCVTCHTTTPPMHTAGDHVSVESSSTPGCDEATCHGTAVVTIHADTGCAGCHDTGAIVPGNTKCETCHMDPYSTIHAAGTTPHELPQGGCYAPGGCHPADAALAHTEWADPPGCAACHGPGKVPSTNCTPVCHTNTTINAAHNYVHPSAAGELSGGCTIAGCHNSTDVLQITPASAHDGCSCHVYASPTLNSVIEAGLEGPPAECLDCHTNYTDPGGSHPFHIGAHASAEATIAGENSDTCTACHGTYLMEVTEAGHGGCNCHLYGLAVPENDECVSCHDGQYSAHGFDMLVSGHSTDVYGYRGMRTHYDGSQEATVFDTRGNPIQGEWAIPTARVFWTPGATNTPDGAYLGEDGLGLDDQSAVTCRDCHTGIPEETGDPHGAQEFANAGIDPDYPVPYKNAVLGYYQTGTATRSDGTTFTLMPALSGINYRTSWETTFTGDLRDGTEAVICAKCHDLWEENAAGTASIDGTAAAFYGWGNFVHEEHSRINALGRGDCVNCHAAIPHGWKRPRLLLQTYSGVATQTAGGVETTVAVVGDTYPYANPRGYYQVGAPNGGWGSRLPEFNGAISGLGLLPAVWGDNPDTARGYVAGGPGDHPPIEIGPYGEMTSSFIAPEWQERTSDCQAGCGGSATRHPRTVQGSFIE